MCKERFVNPFTDFGFKRLFGTEANKDILIHFLNSILVDEDEIVSLDYLNVERLGGTQRERKAVYDIYCRLANGSHIIVEMQKAGQEHFIDRTIFYSARAIDDAAKKGDWDFDITKIYTVALLNFEPEEFRGQPGCIHTLRLCDVATGRVMSRKLNYLYLELAKFDKAVDQLETLADKWMYVIKNLYLLDAYPERLKEAIFRKFFEEARISAFTDDEKFAYEESLKDMRDYRNTIAYARKEGVEEGIALGEERGIAIGEKRGIAIGQERGIAIGEERGEKRGIDKGKLEVARNMKASGMRIEDIAKLTGLTEAQILAL